MKKLFLVGVFFMGLSYIFSQSAIVMKDVGNFTALRVFDKIPVELISSSNNKVEVTGTKREDVQIINKNGELKVRMTTLKLLAGDDVKVRVYYEELKDIQASEGATVKGTERIEGRVLSLNAKEGAEIALNLDVQKIVAKVNTGGEISVTGKAKDQDIVITSGGNYHSKNLDAQNTVVSINAGGNAEVTASGSLDAKTRAGGVIDVYGHPKHVKKKSFAGGKINIK